MKHVSAVARNQRTDKLSKLFFLTFVMVFAIALYWHWSTIIGQAIEWQRLFHSKLASHIGSIAEDAVTYGWGLIALSFAYGVFHAVGPGHGKAVIATYLGTHRESLAKGIGISMATALLQSIVAIALVSTLVNVLRLRFSDIDNYGEDMALVSYVMVMLLGVVLSASAIRRLVHLLRYTRGGSPGDYDHDHDNSHMVSGCACRHAHVPAVGRSWLQITAVVFSVGIRPCSGAIVVLIYAHLVGVFYYGVAATLFMGLGTGLTVSTIALGSQYARQWLERTLLSSEGKSYGVLKFTIINISIRLAGGAILILLGWGLYQTTLRTSLSHPLL
jgi:ABC-type nickel/cobalt efflux system permease component RcnA